MLARRIAKLDNPPFGGGVAQNDPTRMSINRFGRVMESANESLMKAEGGRHASIDPAIADEMVEACRLIAQIAADEPSLISGPLRTDRQHWVAIAEEGTLPNSVAVAPSADHFNVIAEFAAPTAAVQPKSMGLYTSTVTPEGRSMWREYLEGYQVATLYPLPWHVWEMKVAGDDLNVAEIVSARRWVEFVEAHAVVVETHPLAGDDLVYPDWEKIAREFDAVHVTLPAIMAAQGFYFHSQRGLIAPAFWDVETTFWLRWCFTDARLVETVNSK